MKKITVLILSIAMIFSLSAVAFAEDVHAGAEGAYTMGDVDLDGNISAGDARIILRCSVGLDKISGINVLYADVNFDGNIAAADARLALRASVGLENLQIHVLVVDESEESTCTEKGYVVGGCTECQVIIRIELPLAAHTPVAEPCSTDGECTVCGTYVKVRAQHNMSGTKCTLCGYFDKKAAYDFLYDYVHTNGFYEAPDFCVNEDTEEMTLGLYYDTELDLLYLGSNFYLVDEYGNALAAYNVFIDFDATLNNYSAMIIVYYGADEPLTATYKVDASSLNMETPGAISELEYFGPEEIRESIATDCEIVLINILVWFDDFAARNNFGFSSLDMGFVSL